MILLYILFALTLSAILTGLLGVKIPEQKRSDTFIIIFVALMLAGWAVVQWFLPIVALKGTGGWVPALLIIIFGAILVLSAVLSARSRGPLVKAAAHHSVREDAEAIGFDIGILVLMAVFGIALLRALRF